MLKVYILSKNVEGIYIYIYIYHNTFNITNLEL